MYADTDFLLGLIKDEDWLKEASEKAYRQHSEEIWVSREVLIELLMIAYKEDWNCKEVLANIEEILKIEGNVEDIFQASVMIEEKNLTPMDAIHVVKSGEEKILTSDQEIGKHSERIELENME